MLLADSADSGGSCFDILHILHPKFSGTDPKDVQVIVFDTRGQLR